MHAQQLRVGDACREPAVLDAGHRAPDQAGRVDVLHAGFAGQVEHADQLPGRVVHRRGEAAEDAVRRAVVLAAAHLDRAAFGDGGADRVGAHLRLAPAHPGHQRDPAGLVEEARAAFGIEDPAVRIGQQHDAAGRGDVGGEAVQLGAGQLPQRCVALAQFAQARGRQRFGTVPGFRRDAHALAAPPRVEDGAGHAAGRDAAVLEEHAARLADAESRLHLLPHLPSSGCRIARHLSRTLCR